LDLEGKGGIAPSPGKTSQKQWGN